MRQTQEGKDNILGKTMCDGICSLSAASPNLSEAACQIPSRIIDDSIFIVHPPSNMDKQAFVVQFWAEHNHPLLTCPAD